MAKVLCLAKDIKYTILPYSLDSPIQLELLDHPSEYVLGYVTYNPQTGDRKFTNINTLIEVSYHWSLSILKESPYCEQNGPWIIYSCSPEETRLEFGKILKGSGETLHIYNWDTWSLEGQDSKVVVVNSWEIF